jgi:hypothetical protein
LNNERKRQLRTSEERRTRAKLDSSSPATDGSALQPTGSVSGVAMARAELVRRRIGYDPRPTLPQSNDEVVDASPLR